MPRVPREVVALVSADDVVAAVRVYGDRVHDLLRRSGCGAVESIEVCESYAFALVDAIVNSPESVGDMAGWWFGRALELGRRLGGPAAQPAEEATASVLSGTAGEAQVRAALQQLPDQERSALMLRDGYDLPPEAVAIASGRSIDTAADLVAVARLHLIELYDGRAPRSVQGHTGRGPVDIGLLGRLADGSLAPQIAVGQRRHLRSCATCEDLVESLAKARRLCAGLPIIAMPDDAREAMLDRVSARATSTLPDIDEVLLAVEADEEARPAISPVIVVFAILLALVLGVGIAALTSDRGGGGLLGATEPTTSPTVPTLISTSATPRHHHRSISPTPTHTTTPTPTQTTSASPTPTITQTTAPPPAAASIQLVPSRGPRGTTFHVVGDGWRPGVPVRISYTGTLVSSSTQAIPDSHGRFSATLTANGTLPGAYTVTAQSNTQAASATFQQTT